MFSAKKTLTSMVVLSGMGLLANCGGSSSSTAGTGTFSLNITDGPVDNAAKVVVEFTGVSIKPANGEVLVFDFAAPKSIDLLQLQGSASDGLLTNEVVPSGRYEWIRLHVNATRDSVMDSYMLMNDGTEVELYIPSGGETGLKLVSGFTVAAGGGADFTIDFDLRKSITNPRGMPSAILKPALRIVDNIVVGTIAGTIDGALVTQECADPAADDGSVYVYSGAGATPMDIQGTTGDPLATALVHVVEGVHTYEVGFLAEGDYTVAYTCTAGIDDPITVDAVTFVGTATVPVLADMATAHDFKAGAEATQ
jgi:hypothetical protein